MARPKTKDELISAAEGRFAKLWEFIDSMDEKARSTPFNFREALLQKEAHWKRDKNIRDVLVHLYEWHELLLNWTATNRSGEAKPFLPAPYNWKTYGEMNVGFWEKHQVTSYEDAEKMLRQSHGRVIGMIETFSEGELFEKGALSWTGGSTLGQYCVSATSSHYDWAIKKLKEHVKGLK